MTWPMQVQRYLQDYAASDGGHLPTADVTHSQDLYAAATATGEANAGSDEHISRCFQRPELSSC
jgi:hypothetical protein